MSEWCANCHGGMLQDAYTSGMAGLRHPAGNGAKLTADIAANYNAYVTLGHHDERHHRLPPSRPSLPSRSARTTTPR